MNNHLTNDEIQKYVHSGDLATSRIEHIQQCVECQSSIKAFETIFQSFEEQKAPANDHLWQRIEKEQRLSHRHKMDRFKLMGMMSLAASLMLVIGIQWSGGAANKENRIQQLMHLSQSLEWRLSDKNKVEQASFESSEALKSQLFDIDNQLQVAYEQGKGDGEIERLWTVRIEILKQLVNGSALNRGLETI